MLAAFFDVLDQQRHAADPDLRPGARFCVAVQWHPENFWRTGEFRSLFEEFIKAADSH